MDRYCDLRKLGLPETESDIAGLTCSPASSWDEIPPTLLAAPQVVTKTSKDEQKKQGVAVLPRVLPTCVPPMKHLLFTSQPMAAKVGVCFALQAKSHGIVFSNASEPLLLSRHAAVCAFFYFAPLSSPLWVHTYTLMSCAECPQLAQFLSQSHASSH